MQESIITIRASSSSITSNIDVLVFTRDYFWESIQIPGIEFDTTILRVFAPGSCINYLLNCVHEHRQSINFPGLLVLPGKIVEERADDLYLVRYYSRSSSRMQYALHNRDSLLWLSEPAKIAQWDFKVYIPQAKRLKSEVKETLQGGGDD